jgi:NAD(P)H-dependent FMN reductase
MKVLAFAGSNSSKSINKRLVTYVASHYWGDHDIDLLDLNDFPLPVFGVDLEAAQGFPAQVNEFASHIDEADVILVSLAEHNGAYAAVFKNLFDWLSRLPERTVWMSKPVFILGTSPGGRGAKSVIEMAEKRFPFNGGKVVGTFSLAFFSKNFDDTEGISDPELKSQLDKEIEKVKKHL